MRKTFPDTAPYCDLPIVLHVFSTFNAAGPQRRTIEILRATANEYRHFVIAMDGNYRAAVLANSQEHRLCETLPPPPLLPSDISHFSGFMRRAAAMWRLWRNARWLFDVLKELRPRLLLTYNLGASSALLANYLGLRCPAIHAEDGFSGEESTQYRWARTLMRRVLTQKAAVVVVPSQSLLSIARSEFARRTPLLYIPNGIDCDRFLSGHRYLSRELLGFHKSDFVIGCVAHQREGKGHLKLLKAFAMAGIENGKLMFIGDGPMRKEIQRFVEELGILHCVLFTGDIDDPSPYYRAMDVFALASDGEQMPLCILEAMASGLPVVCTAVGDCAVMVGSHAFAATVAVDDLRGFARSLSWLCKHPQLARAAGIKNRDRCKAQYDLSTMLERYTLLYRTAIAACRDEQSMLEPTLAK